MSTSVTAYHSNVAGLEFFAAKCSYIVSWVLIRSSQAQMRTWRLNYLSRNPIMKSVARSTGEPNTDSPVSNHPAVKVAFPHPQALLLGQVTPSGNATRRSLVSEFTNMPQKRDCVWKFHWQSPIRAIRKYWVDYNLPKRMAKQNVTKRLYKRLCHQENTDTLWDETVTEGKQNVGHVTYVRWRS